MILGADTDELREAQREALQVAETTDTTVAFLTALVVVLRAASFWTGGSSAVYADYLDGTVIPWLKKLSMALKLLAKVLGANAQAQDEVSAGNTVDLTKLPHFVTPKPLPVSCTNAPPPMSFGNGTGSGSGAGQATFGPGGTTAGSGQAAFGPGGTTAGSGQATFGPGGTTAGSGQAAFGPGGTTTGSTPSTIGQGGMATENEYVSGGPNGWLSTTDATHNIVPKSGLAAGTAFDLATPAAGGFGTSASGLGSLAGGSGVSDSGTGGYGTGGFGAGAAGDLSSGGSLSNGGGLGGGAVGGGGGFGGGSGYGGGSALSDGGTGGALGAGSVDSGTGSAGGVTSYQGALSTPGAGLHSGLTAVESHTPSHAGTYAAAGTAGAVGLGGAAALAGTGKARLGTGYTSPDGFDYQRVAGIKGNAHVSPEFLRRTEQVASKIGCKPEDLLAVMSFETGGTFDPAQRNNAGGSARGLIQFMPDTAAGLGTSSAALARMTGVQQLDYVEKYFGKGTYPTVEALYSKVLAGRPVSEADAALFREGTRAYAANRGVDLNRDGVITAGEAAAKVRARIGVP